MIKKLKTAAILALLNMMSYFLLTIDFRATAQANILWSIISNAAIALLTFTILKRIVEAKTKMECFGYIVGGTLGNVLGIYLTLWIFGK